MCFFFVRDSGEGEDDRGKKRLRLSIEEKEEGAGLYTFHPPEP